MLPSDVPRINVVLDVSKVVRMRFNYKAPPPLPPELLEECLLHVNWTLLVATRSVSQSWRDAAVSVLQRRRNLVAKVLAHPEQRRHDPTTWLENQLGSLDERTLVPWLAATQVHRLKGVRWSMHQRYQPQKVRSRSANSYSLRARDLATGVAVQVHKVELLHPSDALRVAQELELLQHFRHENILGLYDVLPLTDGKGDPLHEAVYWVAEHTDTDLHYVIHSKQPLSELHNQYLMYQLFRGLRCLHGSGVVHCDLKPAHLLVNKDCQLRIGSIGTARPPSSETTRHSSVEDDDDYVVARWYRPTELLLGQCNAISPAVDIYSAGSIIAECWLRTPLLQGKDYLHQLRLIHQMMIGTVTDEHTAWIQNPQAATFLRSLPQGEARAFETRFEHAPAPLRDLLEETLEWNPTKRIDAASALNHDWFAQVRATMSEDGFQGDGAWSEGEQTVASPFAWNAESADLLARPEEVIAACRERVRAVAYSFRPLDAPLGLGTATATD